MIKFESDLIVQFLSSLFPMSLRMKSTGQDEEKITWRQNDLEMLEG